MFLDFGKGEDRFLVTDLGDLAAFQDAFVDVLELAHELKLLKLGNVSLDGTHLKVNASIAQNLTHRRAVEIREQLRLEIEAMTARAEKADLEEEDNQKLERITKTPLVPVANRVRGSKQ